MPIVDLPYTLQTSLATATLTQVHAARYALADQIELARQRVTAEKHAAASTLLSNKPINGWTPEDHLLFMDASGDHQMPAGSAEVAITAVDAAQRAVDALYGNRDPEIPF